MHRIRFTEIMKFNVLTDSEERLTHILSPKNKSYFLSLTKEQRTELYAIIAEITKGGELHKEQINVYFEVIQRRRAVLGKPTITTSIQSLHYSTFQHLLNLFKELEAELLVLWVELQKTLPALYHRGPHAAEMANDLEALLSLFVRKIFFTEEQQKLYIAISRAIITAHDLIQDQGPINNEHKSYLLFMEKLTQKLSTVPINKKSNKLLTTTIDDLAWEMIVPGTIFSFSKQLSLTYFILCGSAHNQLTDVVLRHSDIAVALAQLFTGIVDTQRCSQMEILEWYIDQITPGLLDWHLQLCGPSNILFKFIDEFYSNDRTKKLCFAHMAGQNIRAKLELVLIAIQNGDLQQACRFLGVSTEENSMVYSFANFMSTFIGDVGASFDDQESMLMLESKFPERTLLMYFNFLKSLLETEINFANGFNPSYIYELEAKFRIIYNDQLDVLPENMKIVYREQYAGIWQEYARTIEIFLQQAKEENKDLIFKQSFINDFTRLASHSLGTVLLRNNYKYGNLLHTYYHKGIFNNLSCELKCYESQMQKEWSFAVEYILLYKYQIYAQTIAARYDDVRKERGMLLDLLPKDICNLPKYKDDFDKLKLYITHKNVTMGDFIEEWCKLMKSIFEPTAWVNRCAPYIHLYNLYKDKRNNKKKEVMRQLVDITLHLSEHFRDRLPIYIKLKHLLDQDSSATEYFPQIVYSSNAAGVPQQKILFHSCSDVYLSAKRKMAFRRQAQRSFTT